MSCGDNIFGLTQYDGDCSFFTSGDAPLPEGLGWFILIGLGAGELPCRRAKGRGWGGG